MSDTSLAQVEQVKDRFLVELEAWLSEKEKCFQDDPEMSG